MDKRTEAQYFLAISMTGVLYKQHPLELPKSVLDEFDFSNVSKPSHKLTADQKKELAKYQRVARGLAKHGKTAVQRVNHACTMLNRYEEQYSNVEDVLDRAHILTDKEAIKRCILVFAVSRSKDAVRAFKRVQRLANLGYKYVYYSNFAPAGSKNFVFALSPEYMADCVDVLKHMVKTESNSGDPEERDDAMAEVGMPN